MTKHTFKEHQRSERGKDVDMMEVERTAMRATLGDDAPMATGESAVFNSHQAEARGVTLDDSDLREQSSRGKSISTTSSSYMME